MVLLACGAWVTATAQERPVEGGMVAPAPGTAAVDLQAGPVELQNAYAEQTLIQELVQESARRGLPERVDVQDALRQARWQVLVQALKEDVVRNIPAPKEDELRRTYDQQKELFRQNEAYKVDAYAVPASTPGATVRLGAMVAARRLDDKALAELRARSMARSTGPWIGANGFHPDIWSALSSMKDGDVRLFPLGEDLVLVRRVEYRAERNQTFEEARDRVKAYLMKTKADAAWGVFVKRKIAELGLQ